MEAFNERLAVLEELSLYLSREQIERITPLDLVHAVARRRGAFADVYLSRLYSSLPDITVKNDLWSAWRALAELARKQGRFRVFDEIDWRFLTVSPGTPLSKVEPLPRLFGYRGGNTLELWGGCSRFADAIDEAGREAIQWCLVNGFDENVISAVLLEKLGILGDGTKGIELADGNKVRFSFAGYKLSGSEETDRGDIAFVIIRDDRDYAFCGVGYMEAKRRYPDGKFHSLSDKQLCRILLNEPHALLALYDNDPSDYDLSSQVYPDDQRVAILPMSQVASDVRNISKLCRYSFTLGHQIAVRYANGADLRLCQNVAEALVQAQKARFMGVIAFGTPRELKTKEAQQALERFERIETYLEQLRLERER